MSGLSIESVPQNGRPRGGLIGQSPKFLAAVNVAERFATSSLPLLIIGETGTGKELVARYVHDQSGRTGDFVDLDCGAIPTDLAESLLFGHRRGAFTGAHETTTGLIEAANGGTLFLDEMGSLPPTVQRKLLRVLETGELRRLGGSRTRAVDFRLVAAAQTSLAESVARGDFRFDLLQRIAGAVIRLPALAERGDDVIQIARHFAHRARASLSACATEWLTQRGWPGNVRELRWLMQRAVVVADQEPVTARALDEAAGLGAAALRTQPSGASDELLEVRAACREFQGDPDRVADALGIGRSTLYRRLAKLGLDLGDFRGH